MIDLDIKKTVLDNGVRILSARMPYKRTVSLGVWLDVGARDELPHESGYSHFIEHMVFKGSTRRTAQEISCAFDLLGGHANAFTSMEHTCFHGRAVDEKLADLADVLFDMVLNPAFDATEIRKERPVVLQEISMVEDDPDDYVSVVANRSFWQGTQLANTILGLRGAVKKFNRADMQAYFTGHYQPAKIVVTAAGNVNHDKLVALAEPYFNTLVNTGALQTRRQAFSTPHHKVVARDTEQVNIYLSLPGESIVSEKRFAMNLLNTVLGSSMSSRLYREIREKHGLAYSVYSFLSSFTDAGMLSIYLGVAPRDIDKAMGLVMRELEDLAVNGITEPERENALSFLQGNLYLSAESTDSQMSRLAQNEINFGRYIPLEETMASLRAVRAEDIRKLAALHLDKSKMGTALLGPLTRSGKPL